jgi:hypothetical protein
MIDKIKNIRISYVLGILLISYISYDQNKNSNIWADFISADFYHKINSPLFMFIIIMVFSVLWIILSTFYYFRDKFENSIGLKRNSIEREKKDETHKFVDTEQYIKKHIILSKKLFIIFSIPSIIFIIKEYNLFDYFLSISTPKKFITLFLISIVLFFLFLLNKFSIFLRRKVVNFFKNQGEFKA